MKFKKIALIVNTHKDRDLICTKSILEFFGKKSTDIYIDESLKCRIEAPNTIFLPENRLFEGCGLIVVIGGDGTVLRLVKKIYGMDIPMMVINHGRVGFMSEIEPNEIHLLEKLYTGEYKIENRMMLDSVIRDGGGKVIQYENALNEVVLSNGRVSRMINIQLRVDGNLTAGYRSDGIIAATPTGSTAYSLSAGGPVIAPDVECFCVTPVCPHSLIQRPFIFSAHSELELRNLNNGETEVYFTADGQDNIRLYDGYSVRIKKSAHYTKLISLKTDNFVKKLLSINQKFGELF